MSTKIEWTDRTWNPVTGCNKVSQGCKNCYAEIMHKRLKAMGQTKYKNDFLNGAVTHSDLLLEPDRWEKPQMVFVNSMSDLFHKDVPFEFISAVFSVMSDVDRHFYQVLTKRSDRMLEFFKWKKEQMGGIDWEPSANVALGVSIEDQETANERVADLLRCMASVRFLSIEPLLAPVNLSRIRNPFIKSDFFNCLTAKSISLDEYIEDPDGAPLPEIDWVIVGGESGHNARPMHPDWVRSIRDQCEAACVPFFFKQWGSWLPECQTWKNDRETSFKKNRSALVVCDPEFPRKRNTYHSVNKKNCGHFLDNCLHLEYPEQIIDHLQKI